MFIPIGDNNSNRRTIPVIVPLIIAINIAVWILQLKRGDALTNGFSFVPAEITRGKDLVGTIRMVVGKEPISYSLYPSPHPLLLTIFSAMFMHGSWGHLLGNMVYLWIFGDQIEDRLGKLRFLFFYFGCGVAATAAHYLADTKSLVPCLGASGAIAGILGAYLILYPGNRVTVLVLRFFIQLPAYLVLGVWFVMQLVGQFGANAAAETSLIAYAAHLGGFVAGAFGIVLLRRS
jgi:membrane associated rhomboid family serine protease